MNELIERVVRGEASAWHELWAAVEPTVWAISGKPQIVGALARRTDERRNIVVDVMARLAEHDFRRLRQFLDAAAARTSTSFKAWLATVTARAAIDYVRGHPEYLRRAADVSRHEPRWVQHTSVDAVDDRESRADPLRDLTVREVLASADATLTASQKRALSLWLEGEDHAAIAEALDLPDAAAADKLVRAALKRLRDRFATASTSARGATLGQVRATTHHGDRS
ncbi:MAG: hypothetical protein U0271_19360 [Polyangiaceae bacterium]